MLQIASAHEVCASAFQSRLANPCALSDASSFRVTWLPVRDHLLDGMAGRCDFEGLILARSRHPSLGLLTRARAVCTLLRFGPYGRWPRPRSQLPGFHSLVHFFVLPLQGKHRCFRVLTCRERVACGFSQTVHLAFLTFSFFSQLTNRQQP